MKYKICVLVTFLIFSQNIYSQDSNVLEFTDKPIIDILLVLGNLSGKKIISDKSVKGNCSYYFSTKDLNEALNQFILSQDLYMKEYNGIYSVSKINMEYNDKKDITINCIDTDIDIVLNDLSKLTEKTILFDNLPILPITLNINELKLEVVLNIINKKFKGFIVEKDVNYYQFKKHSEVIVKDSISETNGIIIDKNNSYSIDLNNVRLSQVLLEFFNKSKKEYSQQGTNNNIIERISFKNKTFDQMLLLILEAGSSDYVLSNNIYYLFDINRVEVANRHLETNIIKLKNLKVKELIKLMPGNFMSNNVLKVDESSNSVIIYGTKIKTEPIINFIKLIDLDKKQKPRFIKMDFISSDNFKNIILRSYSQDSIINIDNSSFYILLNESEYKNVLQLKEKLDKAPKSHLITLKYLKSEVLLESLPKSVTSDEVRTTPNPSVICYYGEDKAYNSFLNELSHIDKPIPQIKYKILVIQNTIGDDFNFGITSKGHSEGSGDIELPENQWNAFSGSLGALLGLNFNVLSAFGPLFSFELNASLNNNNSKILVDTTLQGLSGKKVSFRNTTTSRFYQSTVNSDGESEKTGATQEVSWGIILDIEGWTSGDGMVTVNIQSTLSDESKVSGDSSGIPSTSEKIVNTEIRTREGEPVVIGGLLSSKKEITLEKTPLLGDIPFLGFLFRRTVERETRSEFTIYLLPFIEDELEDNLELKLEKAYKELL